MKAYVYILSILLLTTLGSSCCKDCDKPSLPPPPIKEYDGILSIVWHRIFNPDTSARLYLDPIFWNDYVIYVNSDSYAASGMRVFHKKTGTDHPIWRDKPTIIADNKRINDMHLGGADGNILYYANAKRTYATNLTTGQRVWTTQIPQQCEGISWFSMLGNAPLEVYYPTSYAWSRTARLHPATGERTDLVETKKGADDEDFFMKLSTWTTNMAGDTLLLFLDGGWNYATISGSMRAYCYNITRKEFVWKKENFAENEGGYIGMKHPLIIANNKVVFQCVRSLFCFDIATGDLVWKWIPNPIETYANTPVLYVEGKLYTRCVSGKIHCLDAQTGQVLWSTGTESMYYRPAPSGRMDIYKGKLYFAGWGTNSTFLLYCLDAQTGQLIWNDKGPMGDVDFGVLVDQQTGYLYATTDWSMFCVDLNKTPIK